MHARDGNWLRWLKRHVSLESLSAEDAIALGLVIGELFSLRHAAEIRLAVSVGGFFRGSYLGYSRFGWLFRCRFRGAGALARLFAVAAAVVVIVGRLFLRSACAAGTLTLDEPP